MVLVTPNLGTHYRKAKPQLQLKIPMCAIIDDDDVWFGDQSPIFLLWCIYRFVFEGRACSYIYQPCSDNIYYFLDFGLFCSPMGLCLLRWIMKFSMNHFMDHFNNEWKKFHGKINNRCHVIESMTIFKDLQKLVEKREPKESIPKLGPFAKSNLLQWITYQRTKWKVNN